MLFAHGWEDGNVAPTGFVSLWANVTGEKRLWMQQHGHGVPASKTAYHEYVHRWLDHFLLGLDNGALLLPPVIIEDNLGGFRAETDWPPHDAAPVPFNLTADGKLSRGPAPAGTRAYTDSGSQSEDPRLEGIDHLTFTTGPLSAPLHLAGAPVLHLRAATNLPGTQFDVNLYDAVPDGTIKYVSRGFQDARHKDSLDHGKDLTPNAPYDIQFPLHFNDHILLPGHSLVLVVKSSDNYVVRSPYRATNTLTFGGISSWVDLPVIDASHVTAKAAPAPWSTDAPAS
jgi:X-Pro dipeptidyl-peptidase